MMPPWPGIVLAKSYRREEVRGVETDDIQQVMVTLQPGIKIFTQRKIPGKTTAFIKSGVKGIG